MNLSTKELLYLEDLANMFETVEKSSHQGMQLCSDSQGKTLCQTIAKDHHQWISSVSTLVNSNGMIQ